MSDKCYFCLDQFPKLKKESTASFFVNFGGAGVQKSRPTLLQYHARWPLMSYVVRVCTMVQRSNVILIALKVQNSFKQSFGAKVQRRSVQSRSDLQSKRRVERLYWRLLPGSDKVVVSYCWAELGLQMVMVKIRNDHDYK